MGWLLDYPICQGAQWGNWEPYYDVVDVTWSFPEGPPDLCTPKKYTIRATLYNPHPVDSCGCYWGAPDDPLVLDTHVTVVETGKCCFVAGGGLGGWCDVTTEEECLAWNTTSPPDYIFGGGGPCCDSGCCWRDWSTCPPPPYVNQANAECCSQWGVQFLPNMTCCGDTERGASGAISYRGYCDQDGKLMYEDQDSCGNQITIWCVNSGWLGLHLQFKYNSTIVGECLYYTNLFNYWFTSDGRRFHSTHHITKDFPDDPPRDYGANQKYDFKVNDYDCIHSTFTSPDHCCQSDTDPYLNQACQTPEACP